MTSPSKTKTNGRTCQIFDPMATFRFVGVLNKLANKVVVLNGKFEQSHILSNQINYGKHDAKVRGCMTRIKGAIGHRKTITFF